MKNSNKIDFRHKIKNHTYNIKKIASDMKLKYDMWKWILNLHDFKNHKNFFEVYKDKPFMRYFRPLFLIFFLIQVLIICLFLITLPMSFFGFFFVKNGLKSFNRIDYSPAIDYTYVIFSELALVILLILFGVTGKKIFGYPALLYSLYFIYGVIFKMIL